MTDYLRSVPAVIHIMTVMDRENSNEHAEKLTAALAPWQEGWQITMQHSVTCIDMKGEYISGNGSGWLCSTLIVVSRWP